MISQESEEEERQAEPLLLPDNIAKIFYATIRDEYDIYSDYIIVLRSDDVIQKWIAKNEGIAHWLNSYSGNILMDTIEYSRVYKETESEQYIKNRLREIYERSDDVIQYSINPESMTDDVQDYNESRRARDYESREEFIEKWYNLQILPIRYSTDRLLSSSLALYYTEEEQLFSFKKITLDQNIVVVKKGQEIRVYDYPPSIERLWEHTKNARMEGMAEDDMMFYFYTDETKYVTAYYNQDKNVLVIRNTDDSFPLFGILTESYAYNLTGITGKWEIYEIPLELDMLLYALTRSGSVRSDILDGISLDETAPYFLKKEVNLLFLFNGRTYRFVISTSIFSVLNIERVQPLPEEQFEGIIEPFNEKFESGTAYVTFTLYDVNNSYIFGTVRSLLSIAIYRFVHEIQSDLIRHHQETLPGFEPEFYWARRSDKKLKNLQHAAPEMFGYKYSKRCQEKNQGVIILEEDLDQWIKEHPGHDHIIYPQKPTPSVKRILFGCSDPRFPKTGLKINTSGPNTEIYPHLLCCYADEKKATKTAEGEVQGVVELTWQKLAEQPSRASESTNKFLEYSKRAYISESLREKFVKIGITGEILRVGAHPTINSLIHCLFQAVNQVPPGEPGYFDNDYLSEMEEFVQKWRQRVLEKIHIEVVMQEMHGYSREEIKRIIEDPKGRFDSALLYRLLEVYFGVNIFVFHETSPNEPVTIEIPRHSIVHIREPRLNIPSVVIFKYSRGAKDEENYYEFIVINNKPLFGPSITEKLFSLFSELYSSYIIQSSRNIQIDPYNTYSVHNMLIEANMVIRGQYIDYYGKCRGFIVDTPIGETGSILCMPQQPINTKSFLTIYRFSSEILDLFPLPTSIDRASIGVWIPIENIRLGLYIPLSDINMEFTLDLEDSIQISNPLYVPNYEGNFYHFTRISHTLDHLLYYITKLYKVYVNALPLNQRNERNKMEFIRLFEVDPTVIYDFDRILVHKERLRNTGLTRVENGRVAAIILSSEKLRNDMIYYTERYLMKQPNEFYTTDPPAEINKFNNIEEFYIWLEVKVKPRQIITSAIDLFFGFAEEEPEKGKKGKRKKKIEDVRTATIYPYPRFYLDPSGQFFIVQNVLEGQRDRAISVSLLWLREGVNRGYNTPILSPLSDANVYIIAGQQIITSHLNTNLPSILLYANDIYAALLPIVPLQ